MSCLSYVIKNQYTELKSHQTLLAPRERGSSHCGVGAAIWVCGKANRDAGNARRLGRGSPEIFALFGNHRQQSGVGNRADF